MNIILVSDDSREADLLKRELTERAPAVKIETAANVQDTMARISSSAPCDVILLDTSIPLSDAINLTTNIREDKKPIGIVSLVDASEKNPPLDLFKAGVDNFVLKRTGFVATLPEALKHAKARRQSNQATQPRRIRLLFAGDPQNIKNLASVPPNMTIEAVPFKPDGRLKLPETGSFQDEVLVIDGTASGAHTLDTIRDVNLHTPDIPVLLITVPGDEETSIQAMRAGASDCIAKTETWLQRLLPVIERENRRRELLRVKNALRTREERLRQIVETIPVGITLLAPDGVFLAVNREGLKLMGSQRPEQVIGKNFLQLLPQQEREKVRSFLATVCNGTNTSATIDWIGFDGTISGFELRAVSMRRDSPGNVAALAAIYPLNWTQPGQAIDEETQQKIADLGKALAESESRYRELQSQISLRETEWAQTLQQVEARRTEAEQQQAILKSTAEDAATRYDKLLEEQAAERAQWEQARQSLKEQRTKIESMAESLRSAQERLLDSNAAEQSQWEIKILGLEENARLIESQKAELEADLHKAESMISQQAEILAAERANAGTLRQELETKVQEIDSQRAVIESALHEAEPRIAQQDETLAAERARADALQIELETKAREIDSQKAAIESTLHEAESRIAQQDETLAAERARADALQLELETKAREIDSQRAAIESALHEAESRIAQQDETLAAERARADALQIELETKAREIDSQRAAIESVVRETESRIAQQDEILSTERARADALQLELETKVQEIDSQRAAIESALHEAESRIAQQDETLAAERARADALQIELETKSREIDSQRAAAYSAIHDAETLAAERSQWDTIRQDLEQNFREMEAQRDSLQIALEELEAHISQQADEHAVERSQWNLARLELEQKCLSHDQRQTILQKALQEAEASLSDTVAEYNSRGTQWQALRLGLEQQYQDFDQQQARLKSFLQELDSLPAQTIKTASPAMESLETQLQHIEPLHADKHRIETDLEALQRKHQELSRFNPAGMVLATLEGVVLSYNAAAAQMLDFSDEGVSERPYRLYAFEGALQDCLRQNGKLENFRWAVMKRDGRLVHIQEHAQLVVSSAGEPVCVERILTDISRTHPQGEENRHARRLEATNELAAATVRDLHELCASLAKSCAQLKQSAGDGNLVHEVAVTLGNSANLGIRNARQFFAFAQKADRAPELLDLNKVLEDNNDLLCNLAGDPIDIQIVPAPRIGLVSASRQDLVQMIADLMTRARETLPLGGTVNIETSNFDLAPAVSGLTPDMPPGTYVQMTVKTEGHSLQPDQRIRSIRMIVERLSGWLEVSGDAQSGIQYQIHIPRVQVLHPVS